eukprot:sb/3476576/
MVAVSLEWGEMMGLSMREYQTAGQLHHILQRGQITASFSVQRPSFSENWEDRERMLPSQELFHLQNQKVDNSALLPLEKHLQWLEVCTVEVPTHRNGPLSSPSAPPIHQDGSYQCC